MGGGTRLPRAKQVDLRPVYHRRADRIVAHVQLCWPSLLVIRVLENTVGDTRRNIAAEFAPSPGRPLVTLATDEGTVAQRSRLTARQHQILAALELSEPPRTTTSRPPSTEPAGLRRRYTTSRFRRAGTAFSSSYASLPRRFRSPRVAINCGSPARE